MKILLVNNLRLLLLVSLLSLCFIGVSGASTKVANTVAEPMASVDPIPLADEFGDAHHTVPTDSWRFFAARVGPALDLPTDIRVSSSPRTPQNTPLRVTVVTLKVSNIQVRADWRVTNAHDAFEIEDNILLLTMNPPPAMELVATVFVEDQFNLLNINYTNLTAAAVLSVNVLSSEIDIDDVPLISVVAGVAQTLATLNVEGGARTKTYSIVAGNEGNYFSLTNSVLYISDKAEVNRYILSIEATDTNNAATIVVMVDVVSMVSLADAPTLIYVADTTEDIHSFTAQGGIGIKTYSIVGGNKGGYFTVDAKRGVLSLVTIAPVDHYTLTIQAQDERGYMAKARALVMISAVLSLTDAPRLYGIATRAKDLHTFIASGGIGIKTYTIIANQEPPYFAIDAQNGTLSLLAAAAPGTYIITVQAEDRANHIITALATVEVASALILTNALLSVIVGHTGSLHTFVASGGFGDKTYTIIAGHTQDNFAIDGQNGVLSILAGAVGIYTVTVHATDARANSIPALAVIAIVPSLSLANVSLLNGVAGELITLYKFAAEGGIGAKTYSIVASSNDDGYFVLRATTGELLLDSTENNIASGFYTLTVGVTDERQNNARAIATVLIADLLLDDAPPLSVIVGRAATVHTFTAQGLAGGNIYTIISGNEQQYFSLEPQDGVLSVVAMATIGLYTLTVQAVDAQNNNDLARAVVHIVASLSLVNAPRLYGVAGQEKDLHTFTASGGIGGKNYFIIGGNQDYFDLDEPNGMLLLLTNAVAGLYTLTVQTEDTPGNTATALATITVAPSLVLPDAPAFYIYVGTTMSLHMFTARGGFDNKTYTLIAGDTDGYFAIDAHNGVLSVSGAMAGDYTLIIQAEDRHAHMVLALATIAVSATLSLADAPPLYPFAHMSLSLHTFTASGGFGAKTYTIIADVPPDYFVLNADSGVLSVQAAPPGMYTLTIQTADERNNITIALATIDVSLALSWVGESTVTFYEIEGRMVTLYTITARAGFGAKTYTITGDEQNYFALEAQKGILSILTAAVGTYTLTLHATDIHDNNIQALVMVGIMPSVSLTVSRLYGVVGRVVNTLMASGGIGAKTYTIIAGNEQGNFALGQRGVLSVLTTATVGIHTLIVEVQDSRNNITTAVLTVEIAPPLVFAEVSLIIMEIEGSIVSLYTFDARGGYGAKTYTIIAGNGQNYFTLNEENGALSLTTGVTVAVYTLAIQARDARANVVNTLAIVRISAALSLTDAPELASSEKRARTLHTFIAEGGIGGKAYTIIAGNDEGLFYLDRTSGVLSLLAGATIAIHTLSVQVEDVRGHLATAVATIEIVLPLVFIEPSLLYGLAGRSFYMFTVQYGRGTISYTIIGDHGHNYMTINNDMLAALDTVTPGFYTLTVQATDDFTKATDLITVTMNLSAALVLPDAKRFYGVATQAKSFHTFAASGGFGDKTYTLIAGNRDYFALDPYGGVLSFLPATEPGLYTLTVQTKDTRDHTTNALATVEISPALVIATPRVSVLSKLGSVYTFIASGGYEKKRFKMLAGDEIFALSTDGVLSLQAVIEIEPAIYTTYTLTMQARDLRDNITMATATVVVARDLSLSDLSDVSFRVYVGEMVSLYTLVARGGFGDKTYTIIAGNDPDYFALNITSGVLAVSTNNTAPGFYTLTLQASDRLQNNVRTLARIRILSMALSDPSLSQAYVGHLINPYTLVAQGGFGDITYTIIEGNEQGYFNITSGVLAVSVTTPPGLYTLTLQASDALQNSVQALARIRILSMALSNPPLLETYVRDLANLYTLTAHGGFGGNTYTIIAGNDPGYFSLNSTTGVLAVSVVTPIGWYTLTLQASDALQNSVQALARIRILNVITLAEPPLLQADAWAITNLYTLIVHGGFGGNTYTIIAGNDPDYFSLNISTGVLAVSAATSLGWYTLTLQVTDEQRYSAQAVAQIEILNIITLTNTPLLQADVWSVANLYTLAAQGGLGNNIYTIIAGNDQDYFKIAGSVLAVSMATSPGFYTLTLQVTDWRQNSAQAVASIKILNIITLANTPLLSAYVGDFTHLYTLAAQGGLGGNTYTIIAGNDPDYFSLNATTGVLVVSAMALGFYTLTLEVADWRQNSAQAVASIQILNITLADSPLLRAAAGEIISLYTFVAHGGVGTNTYTIDEQQDYFALSPSGVLSLTATNVTLGLYTLTVEVSDEQAHSTSAQARIQILSVFLESPPRLYAFVGQTVNLYTFTVRGQEESNYTLVAGGDSSHFALDGGVLAFTNTIAEDGIYELTVRAMGAGYTLQVLATVEVLLWLSLADAPGLYGYEGDQRQLHQFNAQGSIGRLYTIIAGNENYFAIDDSSGQLDLLPNAVRGFYTLTVQVADNFGNTTIALATISVASPIAFSPSLPIPTLYAFVGVAQELYTISVSGGFGATVPEVDWGNITVDSEGIISVNANAASGEFILPITDGLSTVNIDLTLRALDLLSLADAPGLYGYEGNQRQLHQFNAQGSIGRLYTIIAGDQDYFAIDDSSGQLDLLPNAVRGFYTLTIQVADNFGKVTTALATISVAPPIAFSPSLPIPTLYAFVGVAQELYTISVSGGFGATVPEVNWGNVTVDSNGIISVNANAASGEFLLPITDGLSTVNIDLTLIALDLLSLADAPGLYGYEGDQRQLHQFNAQGSIGRLYTIIAGDQDYFAIDDSSGQLDLLPNAVRGFYTLTIQVADNFGNTTIALATISVAPPIAFSPSLPIPTLYAFVGVAQELYTISVSGGFGATVPQVDWGNITVDSEGIISVNANAVSGEFLLPITDGLSTVNIDLTLIVAASLSLPDAQLYAFVDESVRHTFVASGGFGNKIYAMVGDHDYFAIDDKSGVLSMTTEVAVGDYTVTVQAQDARGYIAQATAKIAISASLSLADVPLRYAFAGSLVSLYTFAATDGFGHKTYAIVAGNVNNYFSINTQSGVLSVRAAAARDYIMIVQAQDAAGRIVQAQTTVKISATLSLADRQLYAFVGEAVHHTLVASGGFGSKTYTMVGGHDYFAIDKSGALSMTTEVAVGDYIVTVQVEDARGNIAQAMAKIAISASLSLADAPLRYAFAGSLVSLYTFAATDGFGHKTYAIVAGNVNNYFSINTQSGVLSVRAAAARDYIMIVQAQDAAGRIVQAQMTVKISATLSLADRQLYAFVGEAVHHTLVASGGFGSKTYTIVGDHDYFAIDDKSGVLSMTTEVTVGNYTLTVEAQDARNNTVRAMVEIAISASLSLADAPLLYAIAGSTVSLHTFAAMDGFGGKTYTMVPDNDYFMLNADGVLSVQSASSGNYILTVQAQDEIGRTVSARATVKISVALSLTHAPYIKVVVGQVADVHTFVVTGGIGVKTYTLVAAAKGFTLNSTSGVLSLLAEATVGLYTMTVILSDERENTVHAPITVDVLSLVLTDAPPLYAIEGEAISLYTFAAMGDLVGITYTIIAGNERNNFTLNAESGVLSVQAQATVGLYTLTVQAVYNGIADQALAMVAVRPSLSLIYASPLTVIPGQEAYTFVASGGIKAKTYTLMAGHEQGYFDLDTISGMLLVSPQAVSGVYTLSVQAEDSDNNIDTAEVTIIIIPALVLAAAPPLLLGKANDAKVLYTVVATAGYNSNTTYTIIAGNEDGYFVLNADSGVLSSQDNIQGGFYALQIAAVDRAVSANKDAVIISVLVDKQIIILGGVGKNDVWSSTDGENWWKITATGQWDVDEGYQGLAHHGKLYVMGGWKGWGNRKNDVWSSLDGGKTWFRRSAQWGARQYHRAVSHNGRIYVMGGYANMGLHWPIYVNDVWSSENGIVWRKEGKVVDNEGNKRNAGWGGREKFQAVSHNGRIYVMGGYNSSYYYKDVWSSADGETWSRETPDAGWGGRRAFAAVSHHGKIYIMGGDLKSTGPQGFQNDVWSSVDGKHWSRETDRAWQAGRGYFEAISYQGRIYVMGGEATIDGVQSVNDVWSSADGKNWVQETAAAAWDERRGLQPVVFPQPFALFGMSKKLFLTRGDEAIIHTFHATQGDGNYTYSLLPAVAGFAINNQGVLSVNDRADVGDYKLTVVVWDGTGNTARSVADVNIGLLDDAWLTVVSPGEAMNIHTVVAEYGEGDLSYAIVAGDNSGFFTLYADSGILLMYGNVELGDYGLVVEVADSASPPNLATARIDIKVAPFFLPDARSLVTPAGYAREVHTFSAIGGEGERAYHIVNGNGQNYFDLNAQSGVLSVDDAATVGRYTLTIEVVDSAASPQRATAVALVEVRGQMMVLGGSRGYDETYRDVWLSMDGQDWSLETTAPWEGRQYHQAVVHDGEVYVLGGRELSIVNSIVVGTPLADVWSSVDGMTWTQRAPTANWWLRYGHQAVSHRGSLYVLGGYDGEDYKNDVWSSTTNGETWQLVTVDGGWLPRAHHQVISYQDHLYVMGGYDGNNRFRDVWSSSDGKTWTLVKGEAAWSARSHHQVVAHQGLLYVVGGYATFDLAGQLRTDSRNDVWSSADGGATWELVALEAEWTRRSGHQVLSYHGRLYVLGGWDGGNTRDVWSSVDGRKWTRETAAAGWSARWNHQAVVFPPSD